VGGAARPVFDPVGFLWWWLSWGGARDLVGVFVPSIPARLPWVFLAFLPCR